jgi:dihydrofolate synthase/folylpolyglutamate synthase
MAIETYEQAVAFWNSRINYEKAGMPQDLHALRLDRMRLLMRLLGNPQEQYQIIHVTGTKGKGSTSAMMASILQAGGFRTGLYTSPHLVAVEERIQIDQQAISQEALTACMDEVAKACLQVEQQESPPTFFEIMTAAGLVHFAKQRVDWAVLEVGLGGRFDATNVCLPEIAVITSVSLDHVEQLGQTLEQIAFEKAGIIKENTPVVVGVRAAGPLAVIERVAHGKQAPTLCLGQDFERAWQAGNAATGELPKVRWQGRNGPSAWLTLPLWGEPQADNAAVALAALDELRRRGLVLSDAAIRAGMEMTQISGRLEIVGRHPWLIVDCAHNVASVQMLVDWLQGLPVHHASLLFAVSKDKQIREMLQVLLRGRFHEVCFTRYGSSSRGADPKELLRYWQALGATGGSVEESAATGWQRLLRHAGQDDLVCATGSVFLAGEIRQLLMPK